MINFNYETNFQLADNAIIDKWIKAVITSENCKLEEVNYIFCDDAYLHKLNVEFLNHDTLTDIISFDYSVGKTIQGDIFISVERVEHNAELFDTTFENELHRVIIHGILHYCGYKDKTDNEKKVMRSKEDTYLQMLKNML